MSIYFDYDPNTGIYQTYDYDPAKDEHHITSHQDLGPFLDRMKMLRDNPEYSKNGMKEEFWHYASIPPVINMELLKKGIDITSGRADDIKAAIKEINTHYPFLKATDKYHQ